MADKYWRPNGLKVKIKGTSMDPIQALRNFVLPLKDSPNWIEDSKEVTNTHLAAREWFGLILHAITLSDHTGDYFEVATENTGRDGAVVREEDRVKFAVIAEQTLVTHKERGELMEVLKKRIKAKDDKGEQYAENTHLVVLCNKEGELNYSELRETIKKSRFNVITIIVLAKLKEGNHFLCYLFDKDSPQEPIHICPVTESALWEEAIKIYDSEKVAEKLNVKD